ncbi:MAG TPA: FtsQ-type POTRA domain-containing protein [Actinomycetota bacterium]|nr:FtsQ-type POTRA domain-containing protein [Actinomycetota bacterium]
MAGLVALLALAAWVTRSSIFDARTIEVRGNQHLTRSEVLRLAGVRLGSNLVWFSPGGAQGRLEASPWIASARVSRSLPSTLSISVKERAPVAVVATDPPLLVAADRTVLGPAPPNAGLPRIDRPVERVRVGALLPASSAGLQVVRAMPASLRAEVRAVRVEDGGAVVVDLQGGGEALYGDATDAEAKATALQAVLRWAANHGMTPKRIDVRVPSRPALLPEGIVVPVA